MLERGTRGLEINVYERAERDKMFKRKVVVNLWVGFATGHR